MFIREIFLSDKREKSTYKHLSIKKVNYRFFIFYKKSILKMKIIDGMEHVKRGNQIIFRRGGNKKLVGILGMWI